MGSDWDGSEEQNGIQTPSATVSAAVHVFMAFELSQFIVIFGLIVPTSIFQGTFDVFPVVRLF